MSSLLFSSCIQTEALYSLMSPSSYHLCTAVVKIPGTSSARLHSKRQLTQSFKSWSRKKKEKREEEHLLSSTPCSTRSAHFRYLRICSRRPSIPMNPWFQLDSQPVMCRPFDYPRRNSMMALRIPRRGVARAISIPCGERDGIRAAVGAWGMALTGKRCIRRGRMGW